MRAAKLAMLWVARLAGLFAISRILTRRRLRILCYHGGCIGDENRFNSLLFCPAHHLDERLRWLQSEGFTFVPLTQAVSMIGAAGARPRLPTVLTFDDGWLSTAAVLAPVVERRQLPAALYLCTGYFSSGQPVPDVTLNYVLWKAGPRQVQVLGLGQEVDGSYDLASDSERKALFRAALDWVGHAPSPESMVDRVASLAAHLGVDAAKLDLPSRRFTFMNADELQHLSRSGWQIELHGHEHLYPAGDPARLQRDLEACRSAFRGVGLEPGLHYCYPSGDHDAAAANLLAGAGVRSATTCVPGLVPEGDRQAVYYLPRLLDGENVHELEFQAEMSGFTDLLRTVARWTRVR